MGQQSVTVVVIRGFGSQSWAVASGVARREGGF